MATTEFQKLSDLTPYTQVASSKLRAKIISKFPAKTWEKNGRAGKLLGMIISDGESKTKATIFSGVDEFDAQVKAGKTYAFTNFTVRNPANTQYHNYTYPYEINFSDQTVYDEVDDSALVPDINNVRLTPLDSVVANLKAFGIRAQETAPGQRTPSDVFNAMGVVVSASELNSFVSKKGKSVTKRTIEIVDGSLTKISIVLWGDIAIKCTEDLADNNSVVIIQGLNFNSFNNSYTITSDFDAHIDINPPTDTARSLASWYKSEGSQSTFVDMPTGGNNVPTQSVLISSIVDDEIFANGDTPMYYTITGCISAIRKPSTDGEDGRRGGELYYNACSKCSKKVADDAFADTCPSCNEQLTVMKRYLMSFAFSDGSAQRWFTAFAGDAQKIIGISADDLAAYRETDPEQFERILADASHRTFTLRVRARVDQRDNSEYGPTIRLSVVSVSEVDYAYSIEQKLKDINDMTHNFNLDYVL